jgi:hypothetical protein
VRAAFAPGADAATKQQAVTLLRALVRALEPGSTLPSDAGRPAPLQTEPAKPPDLLSLILDQLRPHLPPTTEVTPRLNIPIIRIG